MTAASSPEPAQPPAAPRAPPPAEPAWSLRAIRRESGDYLRRVYKKADQDNIFFLAGAIAFNVLVAIVPLVLAAVGVAGFFLQARSELGADPTEPVIEFLLNVLPPVSDEFVQEMRELLRGFIANASGLFTIGTLAFAWLATRMIGTLRTVLRDIFDMQADRSIIAGKFFDLQMVFVAGTLLVLNIAITFGLGLITRHGFEFLNIRPGPRGLAEALLFRGLAFLTIWFMFALIYRYLPYRKIHWRTAIIAATFTAVLYELLKAAFSWYFSHYATVTMYGNLASLAILIIWIYYMAVIFVLGGEVGQVAALKRIRRRQKERLN
jgi:membrane protein